MCNYAQNQVLTILKTPKNFGATVASNLWAESPVPPGEGLRGGEGQMSGRVDVDSCHYTQGDSEVTLRYTVDFRRHLVGKKTLRNVCHCDSAHIRFVGKSLITWTFS